jgi:lysozyme family protein
MADFDKAVEFVLTNEAGFVNDPADSGGATNFGISLRFLRELPSENLKRYGFFKAPDQLDVSDIEHMPRSQAIFVYEYEFWRMAPFDHISDQNLCNYIFDCCVLHGTSNGIKVLQHALWDYRHTMNAVKDDGILGNQTLNNLNFITASSLIPCLMAERAGLMRLIVSKNSKDERFLNGWLNRCYRI